MREIRFTGRFKRDYKREKSGRHGKTVDVALMERIFSPPKNPYRVATSPIRFPAIGRIIGIARPAVFAY